MRPTRRREDGSEAISWVFVLPILVCIVFAIVSLSYGAWQRQLIEYGCSHVTDTLDEDLTGLSQEARDAKVLEAIKASSSLLNADYLDVRVSDASVSATRHAVNSDIDVDPGEGWGSKDTGHVDSITVRVRARVTYNVPVLLPTSWLRTTDDTGTYHIDIDRSYVTTKREEVI